MSDPIDIETASEEERSAYRLSGKSTAAWAMDKLAIQVRHQKENDQVAADRIQAITEWRDEENAKLQHDVDFFTGLLHTWHLDQLAADPKAKTIKLPDGVLQARQKPGHLDIDDEQFIPWALEHDLSLVRTKYEPIKSEIKEQTRVKDDKLVNEDGEALPGVTWVEGELSWKAVPA